MVVCCWAGDIEEGEKFIRPLREFGSPVADVCAVKPYLAHQAMFDPSFVPQPLVLLQELRRRRADRRDHRHHRRALAADQVAADVVPDLADGRRGRAGSATTRPRSTAARPRFTYNIGACTETSEGFDEERDWVRSFWSALEPWHEGVYVNFLGDEGRRPGSSVLRAGEVRPAASPEAEVRPGQLLPDQPEHLAELAADPVRKVELVRPARPAELHAPAPRLWEVDDRGSRPAGHDLPDRSTERACAVQALRADPQRSGRLGQRPRHPEDLVAPAGRGWRAQGVAEDDPENLAGASQDVWNPRSRAAEARTRPDREHTFADPRVAADGFAPCLRRDAPGEQNKDCRGANRSADPHAVHAP